MTHMTQALAHDTRPTDSTDDRRARIATTASAVQAVHDGFLHRSLATVGWERRGIFQRLVKTQ
jgi:hypothetical protein